MYQSLDNETRQQTFELGNTQNVVENHGSLQERPFELENANHLPRNHEEISSELDETHVVENHEETSSEFDHSQLVVQNDGSDSDDSNHQGIDGSPIMSDNLPKPLNTLLKASAITSIVSIAAVFGFISWLWWTPQHNHGWRKWVLANRLQLSVTLSSAIIRTAVGTLAALATSMIASVAVERRGVHLHALAQISIARASSSGPLSVGLLALRKSRLDAVVRLIIILLVLSTVAVQLISTLLVSDLQQSEIISFARSVPNSFSFGAGEESTARNDSVVALQAVIGGDPYNYWFRRPHSSETFAEHSEAPIDGEGVDDTGLTVRAFLPLPSSDTRELLFGFKGMARVIDSRVVCLRPDLSNLTICESRSDDDDEETGICGALQLSSSAATAAGLKWPKENGFTFGCLVPFMFRAFDESINVWQTCQIQTLSRGTNIAGFDWPLHNTTQNTDIKLLWKATWPRDAQFGNYTLYDQTTAEVLNSTSNGPWKSNVFRVAHKDGGKDVVNETERIFTHINLTMTMCVRWKDEQDSARQLDIHASRSSSLNDRTIRNEPTYGWNVGLGGVTTERVRKQLNAISDSSSTLRQSHREEILTIDQERLFSSIAEARNGTAWMKYSAKNIPDNAYVRLFEDTIAETGSPARALQALYFTLQRSIYYDLMGYYSPNERDGEVDVAEIVTFEPMQVPVHSRGYWAVTGILAVFSATFAAAVWLYQPMRYSLPGNSWHAIAQVSESAELADVLRNAKLATDDEVERLIQGTPKSPSPPESGSAIAYVKGGFLVVLRRSIATLKSLVASSPPRKAPRFALRDGVFTHEPGDEEVDRELKPKGSQRRLERKDLGRDNIN
ncbi:hypothetical protein CGCTS75_v007609 [Colletotrichum tropicale]|nr:hypothetical protein CGCTS75_v007609 [Colletotrichum tropicale]